MSHIYNQYINACQSVYQPCGSWLGNTCNKEKLCESGCRDNNNCVHCLSDIFRDNHERIYKCFPITYSYVIRYLNVYASEIYHILYDQDDIWNNICDGSIMSIGCGPATELVAIERLMREKGINDQCYYVGFDPNFVWTRVQDILTQIFYNCPIKPCFEHGFLLPENEKLSNTKLLMLNYIISDIYNHSSEKSKAVSNYLFTQINPIIENMPYDSYVLLNDVNSCNMGRDEIEEWSTNSFLKIIHKGFFEYSRRKNVQNFKDNTSLKIINDHRLLFEDTIADEFSNRDNINECRSAFILLKKENPSLREKVR